MRCNVVLVVLTSVIGAVFMVRSQLRALMNELSHTVLLAFALQPSNSLLFIASIFQADHINRIIGHKRENPEQGEGIVARRLGIEAETIDRKTYSPRVMRVMLSQSLILQLEEISRWLMLGQMAEYTRVPDYYSYIKQDYLHRIKSGGHYHLLRMKRLLQLGMI